MNIAVDKAYDSPSWWYDFRGILILLGAYQSSLWKQIRFFSRNMHQLHLEVAIGSGSLVSLILIFRKIFQRAEISIWGIDYAPAMLKGAQNKFSRKNNIKLALMDVGDLKFDENQFDSANIANAIHSFPDAVRGLQQVYRVLRPGGSLALNCLLYPDGFFAGLATAINDWGMKKGILHRPYKQEEIESMCQQIGFKITESFRHGNCLYITAIKATR